MQRNSATGPTPEPALHARGIHFFDDHAALLKASARVSEMRRKIQTGEVYIARSVFSPTLLSDIRDYLVQIGRSSLPNYRSIEKGCPNFHRLNRWDPRAYVEGCFHQFVFFPWNQDLFQLFELFAPVYHLKNMLSGLPPEQFLGHEPQDGCTARLAFQFYPRGIGGLNLHADPEDYHQLTIPSLTMSKKGEDFDNGGAYVEREDGERVFLDDFCEPGDVVYFNARCRHGVERIDPDVQEDWLSFRGRWMLLFAVNRLLYNQRIGDSVDLKRTREKE